MISRQNEIRHLIEPTAKNLTRRINRLPKQKTTTTKKRRGQEQ
jgi:hypothetical protein